MWDPEALAAGRVRLGFFPDKPTRFGIIPRFGTDADVRWFEAEADVHVPHGQRLGGGRRGRPGRLPHRPALRRRGRRRRRRSRPSPRSAWPRPSGSGASTCAPAPPGSGRWTTPWPSSPAWTTGASDGRPATRTTRSAPRGPTLQFEGVTKYDYADGCSAETYRYPAGWFGGETVFAPRSGSTAEDDGYLITFVAEEATGASELYVLDAQRPADGRSAAWPSRSGCPPATTRGGWTRPQMAGPAWPLTSSPSSSPQEPDA